MKNITMYPSVLDTCPTLSAMVMRIIGTVAAIEAEYFQLTAQFLNADMEVVTKMLLAITTDDGRRGAIRKAAECSLSPDDLAIFNQIDDLARPCRERRNEFAHQLWGWSEDLPDALLLFDPRKRAVFMASATAYRRKWDPERTGKAIGLGPFPGQGPPPAFPTFDLDDVRVYREADLRADIEQCERVLQHVIRFFLILHDGQMRARLLPHLLVELQNERARRTPPKRSAAESSPEPASEARNPQSESSSSSPTPSVSAAPAAPR